MASRSGFVGVVRGRAAAVAMSVLSGFAACGEAGAQDAKRPTLNVAKVILAEPGVETPLSIQAGPPDAIPRNSFVRLRGLPAAATLSEGHAISPGAWAIPLVSLSNLRIMSPVAATGRSEIVIALVGVDGVVLNETRTSLLVASAASIAPSDGQVVGTPPSPPAIASLGKQPTTPSPAVPALVESPKRAQSSSLTPGPSAPATAPRLPPSDAPQMKPEDRERAIRQYRKGEEQMEEGSIAAARLLFERAAEAGLAEAALALAATYDPTELIRRDVRGIQPDPNAARRWYERARALGSEEAGERLRRLGAR